MRCPFHSLHWAPLTVFTGFMVISASAAHGLDPVASARLDAVETWAFGIGDGCLDGDIGDRLGAFDLVIADGEEIQAAQVQELHQHGALVLGYLSVGTIENWRWWYKSVKKYRLDYWGDWGEWYADTSKARYRNVILKRVAPWMLGKSLDGLFLDNTDMISDHPRQAAGMRKLVRSLSHLVHERGCLLFTQNGEDVIGPSLRDYDGWNREDVTSTYDFDSDAYVLQPATEVQAALHALEWISSQGLLVTSTDYTEAGDTVAEQEAISNACSVGALPFVSDIGLSRIPSEPIACP